MTESDYNALKECGSKKNKVYAITIMKSIERYQYLKADVIAMLTNSQACKKFFNSAFPILIKVENNPDLIDQAATISGRQRYYKTPFLVNGHYYLFTNHLYGPNKSNPDNRTPFLEWILKKCKPLAC